MRDPTNDSTKTPQQRRSSPFASRGLSPCNTHGPNGFEQSSHFDTHASLFRHSHQRTIAVSPPILQGHRHGAAAGLACSRRTAGAPSAGSQRSRRTDRTHGVPGPENLRLAPIALNCACWTQRAAIPRMDSTFFASPDGARHEPTMARLAPSHRKNPCRCLAVRRRAANPSQALGSRHDCFCSTDAHRIQRAARPSS